MTEYQYLVTVTTDDSQLVADMGMAQRLGLRDTPDSAINWKPVDTAGLRESLLACHRAANAEDASNDEEIDAKNQLVDDVEALIGAPDYPDSYDDEDEDEHPDCTAGKHTPAMNDDETGFVMPPYCTVCGHEGDDVLHKFSSSKFGGTIWCRTCNSTLCDLL